MAYQIEGPIVICELRVEPGQAVEVGLYRRSAMTLMMRKSTMEFPIGTSVTIDQSLLAAGCMKSAVCYFGRMHVTLTPRKPLRRHQGPRGMIGHADGGSRAAHTRARPRTAPPTVPLCGTPRSPRTRSWRRCRGRAASRRRARQRGRRRGAP